MAINTNPLFAFGQDLTPAQVAQMRALMTPRTSQMNADGYLDYSGGGGSLGGQFGPSINFDPTQVQRGTSVGADAEYMDDPTGAGNWYIEQPRNVSTWGGSDFTGMWDDQGKWIGWNSGATDLRGLANWAATSIGSYYAAGAMTGGEGAAASTGANGVNWGNVAANAGKSAMTNGAVTLARGGSFEDALTSAAIGGVTGGAGGYMSAVGVNPIISNAATGALGSTLRGGSADDIGIAALTGGFNGAANTGAFTGNVAVDKALVTVGTGLATGQDPTNTIVNASLGYLNNSNGGTRSAVEGGGGGDENDGAGIDYDGGSGGPSSNSSGGNTVDDYDIWDGLDDGTSYLADPRADENGYGDFDTITDPRADENGYGDFDTIIDPRDGIRGQDGYGDEDTGTGLPTDGGPRDGIRGANGYGDEGLTGEETAAFDKALEEGTLPDWMKALTNGFKTATDFFKSPIGKALITGGILNTIRNGGDQAAPDPMLKESATRLNGISDAAVARANANDADFNATFRPRYLEMMDQARLRGDELYGINMQRGRLASEQADKFYGKVDQMDTEAYRNMMAGQAMAKSRQSNSDNAQMMMRRMAATGINPNDGRYASMMGQMTTRNALNDVTAANMARRAAEETGMKWREAAAGLKSADSSYYGAAKDAIGVGMNGVGNAANGIGANNNGWNATMGVGAGAAGNVGGWGLSRSNGADNIKQSNQSDWNGLGGYTIGKMWG